MVGDVHVVRLPESLDEVAGPVECTRPVDGRLAVAVLDGVERILLRCGCVLARREETPAGDTPTFTQVPPMGSPVFTIAVDNPRPLASVIAANAAAPPPRITRSYSPDILISIRVFGCKSVLNTEPLSQKRPKRSRKIYFPMLQ